MRKYARYKNSGISWIGDVPEHWNLLRLKNTVTLICEKTSDSTLPYIGLENIVSWSGELLKGSYEPDADANKFEKDDVLFSKLRPYLAKCFLADFRGKCSSELLVFRDFQGEKRYLKNILLSYGFVDLVNASTYGTKMPRANWNFIGNCRIPVPPLSEQKAIAEYLDQKTAQINELVSAKLKQIELLKEYKQSVIANAVTGKLDERTGSRPTDERQEKRKWKDSGISWIGKIPENWDMVRNKNFVEEKDDVVGGNFQKYPLLSLTKGGVILRDVENGKGKFPKDFESYKIVKPGNIIFCLFDVDETPRTVGLSNYEGMITGAYDIFQIKNIDLNFYTYFFVAVDNIKALRPLYTGLRKVVKKDRFLSYKIPIPPLSEQKEIVAYIEKKVSSIDSQIASIENQIANLNEYKQSLISDVVTGKVKVC